MHDTISRAGATLNCIDICDQIARAPQMIERLADELEADGFIARESMLAVKHDAVSSPYFKASQMIRPAIENANCDPERTQRLVAILTSEQYRLRLR